MASRAPDAINTVCPETQIQLRIVHMVRNSVKYVPWKNYKAVTADLNKIYTTNAIESLNSVIRKVTKKRKVISTDDAANKVIYLAVRQAQKSG